MGASRSIVPFLIGALTLVNGCAYEDISVRPVFSEQQLQSLCAFNGPLVLQNRGFYQSQYGTGGLLLVAHVANRPLESYLEYQSVGLEYQPDKGLIVTLRDSRGATEIDIIPAHWIRCAEDALELELPSDVFYLWASVGVKNRHLRLQVTQDGGLVMQNLWEEKGMIAVILPVKFTGDGWATFSPYEPGSHPTAEADVPVSRIGDCQDLSGDYSVNGLSVRLDGSLDQRSARDQFFRPEIMGEAAPEAGDPEPTSLHLAHTPDGGIKLRLRLPDGQSHERLLEAESVTCDKGQWVATGKKDRLPAYMLLTGSTGSQSENLRLFRDRNGALLVRGTFSSSGLLFLIPTGTTTDHLLMRFSLLSAVDAKID